MYPATNWILKPGRFSRAKGLTYAISLLVMIAAVKTGLEMRDQGPNHYALLGVPRSASAIEIKRARAAASSSPSVGPTARVRRAIETTRIVRGDESRRRG